MLRFPRCVVAWSAAGILFLFVAAPFHAAADPIPIQIVAGSLEMSGTSGTLSIEGGDRGFTLVGAVGVTGGLFGPFLTCIPCMPGAPISLDAHWSDNDVRGTATFDGVTYAPLGSLSPGAASGILDFTGTAVAPPLEGLAATLAAPFLFSGSFFFPVAGEVSGRVEASLFGSGTATVALGRSAVDNPWSYMNAVYQFEDPDPIPEPGTLMLVGSALAGLAACRRRKTQGRRPGDAGPRHEDTA